MDSVMIIALTEAVLCYFCISFGYILQKKGVGWLTHRGAGNTIFYHNLGLWLTGYFLLNLAIVPSYFALRILNPHLVNAVSGLNIVFTVFLSRLVLGERIFPSDYLYSLTMGAAIIVINLTEQDATAVLGFNVNYLYPAQALPLCLLGIWVLLRRTNVFKLSIGLQAVLLASLGGSMSGLMVTLTKILQLDRGTDIFSYLTSPYLYCHIILSIVSLVAVQAAYKMGDMILVGPAQYAAMVFYPVAASYFIFDLPVDPVQMACFAIIIAMVVMMVRNHSGQVGERRMTPVDCPENAG